MLKNAEQLLLVLLIFFLPSQLAFHFWPDWSLIQNVRVDYLSPSLFLTDVLVMGLVSVWIWSASPDIKLIRISTLALVALLLIVSNILFSIHPLISFIKWFRLGVYSALYFYLLSHRQLLFTWLRRVFPLTVIWLCLLGAMQFSRHSSLGGGWRWLGERPLSLASSQTAQINLGVWGTYLRPYSTLPHPNALAGFLLASLLIIYFTRPKAYVLLLAAVSVLVWATFSRSGILAWLFMSFYVLLVRLKIPKKILLFTTTSLLILAISVTYKLYLEFSATPAYVDRIGLISQALSAVVRQPLTGTGLGTFPMYSETNHQPVHNILILMFAETGLLMMLFLPLMKKSRISVATILIFGVLFITSLFDHYWITLPQNTLVLTVAMSLVGVQSSGGLTKKS